MGRNGRAEASATGRPVTDRETTRPGCCGEVTCEHCEGTSEDRVPHTARAHRVELSIEGLSGEAVEDAARALSATPGVTEALLNPITARAVLVFDPLVVRVESLTALLTLRGARAGRGLARWHIPLPELACGRCAARMEREVSRLAGVQEVTVNRSTQSLTVEYTSARSALDPVRAVLAARGFDPEGPVPSPTRSPRPPDRRDGPARGRNRGRTGAASVGAGARTATKGRRPT